MSLHATAIYDCQEGWTESDADYRDVRDNQNHILYMDGEYLTVVEKTIDFVQLYNDSNEEEYAVFTISREQYDRDFSESIE